jgi:hypothetical protein
LSTNKGLHQEGVQPKEINTSGPFHINNNGITALGGRLRFNWT